MLFFIKVWMTVCDVRTLSKMIQSDLLKWLADTIENDDGVSLEDLKNGLPLLQLLSLISPATVNLAWNTTLEAQECPNISLRNYGIAVDNPSFARERFKASQAKSSLKHFIIRCWCRKS
jgi:hypothetical protein